MNSKTSGIANDMTSPDLAVPKNYLAQARDVLTQLDARLLEEIVDRFADAYLKDRTIYIFGNGGSAALASHAACDLGKGTESVNGNRRFRVMSLTDNVPLITAWANDSSYEEIFAAQLASFAAPGDVAFAISGSGNSPNVIRALEVMRAIGGFNIGMTGFQGGKMKGLCDLCMVVPSTNMQQIEDSHVCAMHAVFLALRQRINAFSSSLSVGARA